MSRRGYFAIGIEGGKTAANLGTLWRSAQNFGAAFIFTVGARYVRQRTDATHATKHVPLLHFDSLPAFLASVPEGATLVGAELAEGAVSLAAFEHPQRAVYILGSEDVGLSDEARVACASIVQIPTAVLGSLNVAVAGSIVMYDRTAKVAR